MNDFIKNLVNSVMTERTIKDGIGFISDHTYIKQSPTTRQQIFLALNDKKEVFYGGAAGGGKSSALLMEALEYVHVPQYAALICRRTYVDLARPGALLDRADEWLRDTDAHWSDQKKTWTFPSGATLTFGYLENENDKYQYQSAEFQFIGVDELSQFTETQYRYLFSRLRRTKGMIKTVPLRMRSGSNPPAEPVGMWVKDRFIPEEFTPADAIEDRYWEKPFVDEETGKLGVRYFVPARIDDNPHLDQESYEESLSELDPVTRAQLRRGDWQISSRGDILHNWSEKHVITTWDRFWEVFGPRDKNSNLLPETPKIPPHWKLGVFQDWGTTKDHPCVTIWFATAAENSPKIHGVSLAGSVFIYRCLIRTKNVTARNVKKQIFDAMTENDEIPRTDQWQMSHEASSERNEYHQTDDETGIDLPFSNWETGRTRGIEQFKNAIDPKYQHLPHPFNPSILGRPKLYILVPTGQYVSPKTEMDGFDLGMARIRSEAPAYKWATPKSGEPPKALVPHPLYNDAMDVIRGAAAVYFPSMEEKTASEVLNEEVLKHINFNPNQQLNEGQQLTLVMAQAKAFKKVREEYGLDEYGEEQEPEDYVSVSGGW